MSYSHIHCDCTPCILRIIFSVTPFRFKDLSAAKENSDQN